MKYNTKSKKELLNLIYTMKNDFTAKELLNIVDKENLDISFTTIYRFLEEAVQNNILNYHSVSNTKYYYLIDSCNSCKHVYLKCNKCMSLTHVNCDYVEDFISHIIKEHSFILDKDDILIKGICSNCKEK